MTQTETLAADMVNAFGMDMDWALQAVAKIPAAEVPALEAQLAATIAEKDALRARIMAEPALRTVLAIRTDWMTAHDRYDVARRALALIERTAKREDIPAEALIAELAADGSTIQAEIDRHNEDPRTTAWGRDFYGFRWRIADALEGTRREEKAKAFAARVAALEAKGREICTRCGGAGGSQAWPGFTCFDCNGSGDVAKRRR